MSSFEEALKIEGRLRFGKIEGPINQEDPILETSEDERESLDIILRRFKNKYIRLTIEVLDLGETDEQPRRRTIRDTFGPSSR